MTAWHGALDCVTYAFAVWQLVGHDLGRREEDFASVTSGGSGSGTMRVATRSSITKMSPGPMIVHTSVTPVVGLTTKFALAL